jgi:nucleotide-binding universal stress UspA family protein
MLNKPNILVCTDFSHYSDDALKAAELIREKTNGVLHVLHVSEYSIMWDWMPPNYIEGMYQLDLLNTLRKKIENQVQSLGIKAQSHISLGLTSNVIIEQVEEKKIDLLVMGHKGRTGKFHLGSVAEKVIAISPVPVIVIKGTFHVHRIGGLLDPNGEMNDIIKWSEDLSEAFSSKLEFISLFPDIAARFIGIGKMGFSTELLSLTDEQKMVITKNQKEIIKNKLKKDSKALIKVEVSTERKIAYHLDKIMIDDKVDLAIMKKHHSEFLEKILIGSETRRMIEIFSGHIVILPTRSKE